MKTPLNERPLAAIDLDDTLSQTRQEIITVSNEMWGQNLTLADYSDDWPTMWGVSHEEGARRFLELDAIQFNLLIPSYPEAASALRSIKRVCETDILTSRRQRGLSTTEKWVARDFPDIFRRILLTGFWDEIDAASGERTKGEICKKIGARFLVDNELKHCEAAAELGVKAIIFDPFGEHADLRSTNELYRASTWLEIETVILRELG